MKKYILQTLLFLLFSAVLFLSAADADAAGFDSIYVNSNDVDIELDAIYEIPDEAAAFIYENTSPSYDFDRILPFLCIDPSSCGNAGSIKDTLVTGSEIYIPSLNEKGEFQGYTVVDLNNSSEIIAYHQGGIYDFIYSGMPAAVKNGFGSDYDEIYFISDPMFNNIGLLLITDGEEVYFDVSAYYTLAYGSGSDIRKYTCTAGELLSARYEEYTSLEDDPGDGLGEAIPDKIYEETEIVEISSAEGISETRQISIDPDPVRSGYAAVIPLSALLILISVMVAAVKR